MVKGYIVIEQATGFNFGTMKFDFAFQNMINDFNKFNIPQEVLDKVAQEGSAQYQYTKHSETVLLTIIKHVDD